ncbi:hypothetical protein PybrP1_012299 [[Pythium] brassicae (nom. inval.)]|nr:hypothetical protein PybrP1_012299 [[Pythium] brassicae (nom. inval.)]
MAPPSSTSVPKNGDIARSERAVNIDVLVHATKLTVAKHENLEHYLRRLTHLTLTGDARKAVRRIENLHHCPNLRVLYLYDNDICAIEGLESTPLLTHVHLQNNRIRKLERLECLPLLEKLYAEGNSIARLEGLHGCCFLQELHLSNQQLASGALFSFDSQSLQAISRSLRILNVSNCNIVAAAPLVMLRSLEQLDLSKNGLSDLEDVFALLSSLPMLAELDLRMNPVTNTPKYREKAVAFSSPRLDKKDVDANQRRMMQSHMAHKFRKRQEAAEAANESADAAAASETRRALKHGAAVHSLRSMPIAPATGMSARSAKARCEREGLGVDGASCASSSSTTLVRASSSNNKHH